MFIRQLPLWIAQTNCWIVSSSKSESECVLVDVPPSPDEILSVLESSGLKPVAILATHGHIDHIGGVGAISRVRFQTESSPDLGVYINRLDKHLLLDPVGTSGLLGQELAKTGIDVRPPELIYNLDDGDTFSGSGLNFKVLHTPGHTKGSICFVIDDGETGEKILFSGDHLFKGSIGRTDLPGGSFAQLAESMRSKILTLDDSVIVLPGHGDTTTIGIERATNPFVLEM
ncbi:MAG: MBL fold metallo-hydrolase [Acidimicrobiaceae bacterium]|nr:MBL fold metallo-hydrolase [Acidimicrobiaceae bacterium]